MRDSCSAKMPSQSKNVSKNVTDIRSSTTFIDDVFDGYVVAAFMFLNNMKSPHENVVPPGIPETLKKTWFYERVDEVVETFVIRPLTSAIEKLQDGDEKDEVSKSKKTGEDQTYCSSIESFHCRWYGCEGTFTSYEKRKQHERIGHGMILPDTRENLVDTEELSDKVLNYTTSLMTMCLLQRSFQDASNNELDGPRLFLHWKIMILFFREAGRSKYAHELFQFQADQKAHLSPADAHRQLWERGFNLRGGKGKIYLLI